MNYDDLQRLKMIESYLPYLETYIKNESIPENVRKELTLTYKSYLLMKNKLKLELDFESITFKKVKNI